MSKPRILVLHPEGNVNTNPNLSGMVSILCEKGYDVDIVSPRRGFPQLPPSINSKVILYQRIIERITRFSFLSFFKRLVFLRLKKRHCSYPYSLIIGVDRNGVLEASQLSQLLKIPFGFISYEILFADENDAGFKAGEIMACQNIEFAVCQDEVRSSLLAKENGIPIGKILTIPVAGRGIKSGVKSFFLHNLLKIPAEKKIVLFAGAIAKWSMIEDLIQSTELWPENWVLVLHNRYGLTPQNRHLLEKVKSSRIFFSSKAFPTQQDLSKMLYSADVGVALYKPMYSGPYDGKNLEYLGLSSGKTSTFLQHGIPVVTNQKGLMSEYIRSFRAGCVIEDASEISDFLKSVDFENCRTNCFNLFSSHLDLDLHIAPLLDRIKNVIKR